MASEHVRFTPAERRAVIVLAGLFMVRMMGLFAVLPLLSPYAKSLPGATPLLIGLAVGAFPLTQTIFQIPFGWLSDRWGRRPTLVLGMALFSAGGAWAALAGSIWELIGAGMLQGSGAVASVILALAADLTRDEVRARVMAIIGAGIGVSFGLGFIAGPLISAAGGVESVYAILAVLGIVAIPISLAIPEPSASAAARPGRVAELLREPDLWRISAGIFLGNGSLRALFVILPFMLLTHLSEERIWLVYLPVLFLAGLVMFAAIFYGERRGQMKNVRGLAISASVAGLAIFATPWNSLSFIIVALTFFLVGFSLLEALLPAAITQRFGAGTRGSAVGIFNVFQYLGAFAGSLLGGLFLARNPVWLFGGLGIAWIVWWLSIRSLPAYSHGKRASAS